MFISNEREMRTKHTTEMKSKIGIFKNYMFGIENKSVKYVDWDLYQHEDILGCMQIFSYPNPSTDYPLDRYHMPKTMNKNFTFFTMK